MFFYRILISQLSLSVLVQALWRRDWDALRARLGRDVIGSGPSNPSIWIHGASNGELTSARPAIAALADRRPDLQIIITSNSPSGVALVRSWGFEARLAPLDLSWATARVMKRWNVVAHITLEKEIWPHRITQCPGPVIVLGAAMSEKTARFWDKIPGLATKVFPAISALSAQSKPAHNRFIDLGVREQAFLPNMDLKSLYTAPDVIPDETLTAIFDRDKTWLAASTHKGEERIVLAAHRRALEQEPDLRQSCLWSLNREKMNVPCPRSCLGNLVYNCLYFLPVSIFS